MSCWKDKEEHKLQLSKNYGATVNHLIRRPITTLIPALGSFYVQSPVCTWSPGLHLSAWSKMELDTDNLTWFGQGWMERRAAQRGKLRVLLGKIRESFIKKEALELGVL